MNHNKLMEIIIAAHESEYKLGQNDCNIVSLRVLDLIAGTDYADIAKYKTIKTGFKQLNTLGFDSTQDIIRKYADEVDVIIDGDIYLDDYDKLIIGVCTSGRVLGVDEEHKEFKLIDRPTDGKYYRIRGTNG
ncbi:DUF6950 family protein [Cedecea lapagei]|uniref:DUF6950 family protein n=1 Tax=Cedecea lapagei TaxID=158823 RepID=UPI001BCDE241|nr:ornithine carbamoyltransferase [Cedecea lapagei]